MKISPAGTGYILGSQTIVYMLFCPFVGWSCQKLNRKLVIFVSLIIVSMATIIIGKEDYLGLPNTLWLHIFTRALRGFGGPGLSIPTIPEY